MSVTTLSKSDALTEYLRYGGMPLLMSMKSDEAKARYLKDLFELTYLKDIIERNIVLRDDVLDELVNILASAVGSLTSVTKLTNTFKSKGVKDYRKYAYSVFRLPIRFFFLSRKLVVMMLR